MGAAPSVGVAGRILLVILASGAVACSTGATSETFVERDSAGIAIVETFQPAWERNPAWQIPSDPVLEIGSAAGEEAQQFYRVTGAQRLSDGRIAVLNQGSLTVRIFGADARIEGEFGGEGDGPGEFRALTSLQVLEGDTLLIWDVRQRRLSFLTSYGEYISSIRLDWAGGEQLTGVRRVPDGHFIVKTYASPFPRGPSSGLGIHRRVAPLLRFDGLGQVSDTIGFFPSVEGAIVHLDGSPVMMDAPFAKNFHFDSWEGSVVTGTAEGMEVQVWDATDGLLSIFRYPALDLTVTQEDQDAFWESALSGDLSPEQRRATTEILQALPFPETRASFTELRVDSDGDVWLKTGADRSNQAALNEWTVFSSSGEMLGALTLPRDLTVLAIDTDEILGVWKNPMGVEFIRVYELRKTGV